MFSILPGIKSGLAALEMLIFSNNFCTPFKVIDKFPIDGYLLPSNPGVAVVLFLANTDWNCLFKISLFDELSEYINPLNFKEEIPKLSFFWALMYR